MVTAFASMMRHETRTALVGIQGLSELIRDGGLSADEIKTCADEIFGAAQKIDSLIGQMFDLNRLETGQTSFRRTRIDVNSIVSEVVLRTRAGTRQLSIGLEQSSVPLFVSGDPDRLRQAIQNVFGFITGTATTGGHIAVAARPEGQHVVVSIGSNTLKIAQFDDWLYGRYDRYEQRPSAIVGAGLDLAIARAIIEMHSGRIDVTTTPREGSEFRLVIPAA
jgi:signal transduction histidine kinase